MTFAVVADLHNQSCEELYPELRKADMILIVGDLINRHKHIEQTEAKRFLRDAVAMKPVLYAIGNHERKFYQAEAWRTLMEESGAEILDNRILRLRDDLVVGGLSSQHRPVDAQIVDRLARESGFRLLLCHHPEYYPKYVQGKGVDLTLAGHAHGGQVRLGNVGLYAPNQWFFPKFTSGFYVQKRLLVSRGMSNHAIVPRIHNPCELILLTLLPGNPDR